MGNWERWLLSTVIKNFRGWQGCVVRVAGSEDVQCCDEKLETFSSLSHVSQKPRGRLQAAFTSSLMVTDWQSSQTLLTKAFVTYLLCRDLDSSSGRISGRVMAIVPPSRRGRPCVVFLPRVPGNLKSYFGGSWSLKKKKNPCSLPPSSILVKMHCIVVMENSEACRAIKKKQIKITHNYFTQISPPLNISLLQMCDHNIHYMLTFTLNLKMQSEYVFHFI